MAKRVLLALALVWPLQPVLAQSQGAAAASARDGQRDFDFEIGTWTTQVRVLRNPLSGAAADWAEYQGTSIVRPIAGGRANLVELAVEVDDNGHASALKVAGEQNGQKVEATLPARTILVAAGTQPNTVLAREDATHAFIDGKYFRALDEDGNPATPERVCKPTDVRVLMYKHSDGRTMSFFGDLHPSFAGNVVKAMGGAKQGYPVLTRTMEKLPAPARKAG